MDNDDDLTKLEELLSADLNEVKGNSQISEIDIFSKDCNNESDVQTEKQVNNSVVHEGDTDSSDDEERRNYMERKYNEYGSQVKKVLDNQEHEKLDKRLEFESRLRQINIDIKVKNNEYKNKQIDTSSNICENIYKNTNQTVEKVSSDIYTDKFFGIRIIKPLISSFSLEDKMQGRQTISMLQVKRHVEHGDLSQDWVLGGVIVRKSSSKKSQKGSQFIIWTLSDLKNDLKTVSVFLFRKAYKELWKTSEGTVVAILNPNVLDKSQNNMDQASLSIDNSERVMVLGQSKDLGTCKSKKKNGEPCAAFVNLNQCEHCVYHVKQEYQKFSRRQELQSPTMGKGLVNLRNKVLGKNTVIYGGQAFTALPVAKTSKVNKRDYNRLMSLSDYYKSEGDNLMTNNAPCGPGPLNNSSGLLHSPTIVRASDSERLSKLSNTQNVVKTTDSSLAKIVANSPKFGPAKNFSLKGSGTIDLNISYGQKAADRAKANAINLIKKSGGLQKQDPHNLKGTDVGKKRALDKLNNSGNDENDTKKLKTDNNHNTKPTMSERFKKILEATSAHQNLITQYEDDEQEKYFNKLEKKEAMEEKMLNTFKLACKAVRCVKCKYTAFSAAQRCKDERHPLKVLDTFKRFFKCGNCGNRTVSLEIIPLTSCNNCNSSKWEKAPMLREKKITSLTGLSVRGEEEVYIGGQVTAGKNINLLVPDIEK